MKDTDSIHTLNLSVRAANCIWNAWPCWSKSDPTVGWIREKLLDGTLETFRNFGVKTYNEIAGVLGLPSKEKHGIKFPSTITKQCPNCAKEFQLTISIHTTNHDNNRTTTGSGQ